MRDRVAWLAVSSLVVIAPFERALAPVPGGFTVTTAEAVILAALVIGLFTVFFGARLEWPKPLILPGALLLAWWFVTAATASVEPGNSFRFAARMAVAAMLCVLFASRVDSLRRARALVRTFVAVATLIAFIAFLEAAQVPAVMSGLTVFRPGFHVVAGQLRATSTLFYPTITSMYLEVAFALGLWLLFEPASRRPRLARVAAFLALAVIAAGISATFTRAGLIGMFVCLALVGALRVARLSLRPAGLGMLAGLGLTIAAVVSLSHSPELLATRLRTEGSDAWYGASYRVPAKLRLETGRTHSISITLRNTGRLTWDSLRDPVFMMSYHWLRAANGAVVQFEGDRTPFPQPIRPGETITLPVQVTAPGEPGTYTLSWDIAHETRAWLSTEGVISATTLVEVTGAPSSAVVTRMDRLPAAPIRPPRPVLWNIALRMSAEHPWLGVGPDGFRHLYGRYAGLTRWDTRVHANNMYLEALTGAGVPGLIFLVALLGIAGVALVRRCLKVAPEHLMPAIAMLAAWVMVVGHGLVDSFLAFTTTYLTFAMAAGLAFSRAFKSHAGPGDI
jgi:O-antigen ligase